MASAFSWLNSVNLCPDSFWMKGKELSKFQENSEYSA